MTRLNSLLHFVVVQVVATFLSFYLVWQELHLVDLAAHSEVKLGPGLFFVTERCRRYEEILEEEVWFVANPSLSLSCCLVPTIL